MSFLIFFYFSDFVLLCNVVSLYTTYYVWIYLVNPCFVMKRFFEYIFNFLRFLVVSVPTLD